MQILFFCVHLRAFFFAPALSSGKSSASSSSPCTGEISKSSVEVFRGKNKFAIFRKDTGIPGSFKADVRAAMKKTPEYNLLTYNCIHFALELLHVDSKVMHLFIFNVTNNLFETYSHDYVLIHSCWLNRLSSVRFFQRAVFHILSQTFSQI